MEANLAFTSLAMVSWLLDYYIDITDKKCTYDCVLPCRTLAF